MDVHSLDKSVAVAFVPFALWCLACHSNSSTEEQIDGAGGGDAGNKRVIERPDGWGDKSHGPDAPPNYDIVFAQDRVSRIDIAITPQNWTKMLEDMESLAGPFAMGRDLPGLSPGNMGEQIPPELIDACLNKVTGEVCQGSVLGFIVQGSCMQFPGVAMFCVPKMFGDMRTCDDKNPGDPCLFKVLGAEIDGTCTENEKGELICQFLGLGMDDTTDLIEQDPVWVPCTVHFEGKQWNHVGVRFKGNSTLLITWATGSLKLPFKLDMDEFEIEYPKVLDQRFYGFKKLAFANNAFDSSYLREKVTGDLFRAGGVPASTRAFYRVFFDTGEGPTYFGLYTMAEVPGRTMFIAEFGDTGGNLYKPQGTPATWQEGLPVDENSFSKKTNELEADWSDVMQARGALHACRENPSEWRTALEKRMHVSGFLRWLALNTVMQDWDTYGNLPHNYYLYGDPSEDGRLHWIPWDHNMALGSPFAIAPPLPLDMSIVSDEWPLIRFLLDDQVYKNLYWSYIIEFSQGAFAAADVKAKLQKEHDLIAPYVIGELGEIPGYSVLMQESRFETDLGSLLDFVDKRHKAIREALNNR
ncbi:MAG: hypothetical protein GY854_27845 [Deltaproteobacteria bacterium]|nr:hypothetical protein [Deltaproteobacteria bacterium]